MDPRPLSPTSFRAENEFAVNNRVKGLSSARFCDRAIWLSQVHCQRDAVTDMSD